MQPASCLMVRMTTEKQYTPSQKAVWAVTRQLMNDYTPAISRAIEKSNLGPAVEASYLRQLIGYTSDLSNAIESRYLRPGSVPGQSWNVLAEKTWHGAVAITGADARNVSNGSSKLDVEWGDIRDATRSIAFSTGRLDLWDVTFNVVKEFATSAMMGALPLAPKGLVSHAAFDAALAASFLSVKDLEFGGKAEHEAHLRDCMDAWKTGFAPLGRINGVLYVFRPDYETARAPQLSLKLREEARPHLSGQDQRKSLLREVALDRCDSVDGTEQLGKN